MQKEINDNIDIKEEDIAQFTYYRYKDSVNRAKNQIFFEFFRDVAYLRPFKVRDKDFLSNLQGFERKSAKRLNFRKGRQSHSPSQANGSKRIRRAYPNMGN